ncbi:MAG TPA: 50S ribosomal protein L25 [Candidatus Binataceae bacterium]|nr:50S ribosomal protein L25 [Candidatus Binataceae bacterium]
METVELSCEKREVRPKGLVNRIRHEGRVPGVIYGNLGVTTAIAVGAGDLKSRAHSAGRQRLIRLKSAAAELDGKHVIIKDLQRTPVSGVILHVDLYEVDLNKPLRVAIALRFVGRAAGIIDGGILQPLEREVEVECLPLEMPETIDVDVTALKIHDVMHISALKFVGNVKPIFDTDFPVVTVLPPTVAEAPVVAAAAEGEAIVEGAAPAPAAADAKTAEPAAKEGGGKDKKG